MSSRATHRVLVRQVHANNRGLGLPTLGSDPLDALGDALCDSVSEGKKTMVRSNLPDLRAPYSP